jgi:hypothetical protein
VGYTAGPGPGYGAGPVYPSFVGAPADWTALAAGYPYGGGLGSSIGMSAYDQALYRKQIYNLNASLSRLQNAAARQAYEAAAYYRALANSAASGNSRPTGFTPASPRATTIGRAARSSRRPALPASALPREKLVDDTGQIQWPAWAPVPSRALAEAREALDAAIKEVVASSRSGIPAVRALIDARKKLYAYGRPAMADVHVSDPAIAPALAQFLNSLDRTLIAWGGPNPATRRLITGIKLDGAGDPAGNEEKAAVEDRPNAGTRAVPQPLVPPTPKP